MPKSSRPLLPDEFDSNWKKLQSMPVAVGTGYYSYRASNDVSISMWMLFAHLRDCCSKFIRMCHGMTGFSLTQFDELRKSPLVARVSSFRCPTFQKLEMKLFSITPPMLGQN